LSKICDKVSEANFCEIPTAGEKAGGGARIGEAMSAPLYRAKVALNRKFCEKERAGGLALSSFMIYLFKN